MYKQRLTATGAAPESREHDNGCEGVPIHVMVLPWVVDRARSSVRASKCTKFILHTLKRLEYSGG